MIKLWNIFTTQTVGVYNYLHFKILPECLRIPDIHGAKFSRNSLRAIQFKYFFDQGSIDDKIGLKVQKCHMVAEFQHFLPAFYIRHP